MGTVSSLDKSVDMGVAWMATFAAVAMQMMKVPPLIFAGAGPWLPILAMIAISFTIWFLASALRNGEGCVGEG